jgi:phosphate transport system protein
MASHLETELGKLRGIIIKIGGLAENQVAEAVKAVLSCFGKQEVKKTENKIDKLDVKIDDMPECFCATCCFRFTIYHLNAN